MVANRLLGLVTLTALGLGLMGASSATRDGAEEPVAGEQTELDPAAYVTPGPCTVGDVKTNRKLLALNCVDWAFRSEASDGNSFDWVRMSKLNIAGKDWTPGMTDAKRTCERVVLPKQVDLTCVQANPPYYNVKVR